MMGLPGTGKTTLASEVAQRLRVLHLSTDRIRAALQQRAAYDPANKWAVYQAMVQGAKDYLHHQESIVMDGTFAKQIYRDALDVLPVTPLWVMLTADEADIRKRTAHKRTFSEADYRVYQLLRDEFDPMEVPHLALNSSRVPLSEMVQQVIAYLKIPS